MAVDRTLNSKELTLSLSFSLARLHSEQLTVLRGTGRTDWQRVEILHSPFLGPPYTLDS